MLVRNISCLKILSSPGSGKRNVDHFIKYYDLGLGSLVVPLFKKKKGIVTFDQHAEWKKELYKSNVAFLALYPLHATSTFDLTGEAPLYFIKEGNKQGQVVVVPNDGNFEPIEFKTTRGDGMRQKNIYMTSMPGKNAIDLIDSKGMSKAMGVVTVYKDSNLIALRSKRRSNKNYEVYKGISRKVITKVIDDLNAKIIKIADKYAARVAVHNDDYAKGITNAFQLADKINMIVQKIAKVKPAYNYANGMTDSYIEITSGRKYDVGPTWQIRQVLATINDLRKTIMVRG